MKITLTKEEYRDVTFDAIYERFHGALGVNNRDDIDMELSDYGSQFCTLSKKVKEVTE